MAEHNAPGIALHLINFRDIRFITNISSFILYSQIYILLLHIILSLENKNIESATTLIYSYLLLQLKDANTKFI